MLNKKNSSRRVDALAVASDCVTAHVGNDVGDNVIAHGGEWTRWLVLHNLAMTSRLASAMTSRLTSASGRADWCCTTWRWRHGSRRRWRHGSRRRWRHGSRRRVEVLAGAAQLCQHQDEQVAEVFEEFEARQDGCAEPQADCTAEVRQQLHDLKRETLKLCDLNWLVLLKAPVLTCNEK